MPSTISSFLSNFWSAFWTIEHLASLATTLVGGLIGGVAATIVAAVRLWRQAPKIAISPQIARYTVRDEGIHYAIKIRNQRWFREAIDLSASLKLLIPEAHAEGVLRRATRISLQRVSLIELNHNKRTRPGAAVFTFVITEDLRQLLADARAQTERLPNVSSEEREVYLAFRLIATDGKHNLRRVFRMKYTADAIVDGRWGTRDSMKIGS
jgi:hypothetical protein